MADTQRQGFLRDDSGALVVVGKNGGRAGAGLEIAYDETATASTGVDAVADLVGLDPITFEVFTGEVVYVELVLPWNSASAIGTSALASITDNANTLKAFSISNEAAAAADSVSPLRPMERITAPGTYTRKGRLQRSGAAGTVSAAAGATNLIRIFARTA